MLTQFECKWPKGLFFQVLNNSLHLYPTHPLPARHSQQLRFLYSILLKAFSKLVGDGLKGSGIASRWSKRLHKGFCLLTFVVREKEVTTQTWTVKWSHSWNKEHSGVANASQLLVRLTLQILPKLMQANETLAQWEIKKTTPEQDIRMSTFMTN